MRTRLIALLPLTECSHLRHSSSIATSTCTWPGTWPNWASSIHTEHLFALQVVVIGNRLTYLEARFYNKGVGQPEILLAGLAERRQELCPRMRRLSGFKSRLSQALWRLTVLAYTNSLMEKPLHRLLHRLTVLYGLEKQQLWLDSCHCQPIDQDGALRASQSHHWRSETNGSHPERGSSILWPIRLNCSQ